MIPAFKSPDHYAHSPLLGAPPLQRDLLLYFRGDLGQARLDGYSRGIRQRLFKWVACGAGRQAGRARATGQAGSRSLPADTYHILKCYRSTVRFRVVAVWGGPPWP